MAHRAAIKTANSRPVSLSQHNFVLLTDSADDVTQSDAAFFILPMS